VANQTQSHNSLPDPSSAKFMPKNELANDRGM
jgi:hypothetical protein